MSSLIKEENFIFVSYYEKRFSLRLTERKELFSCLSQEQEVLAAKEVEEIYHDQEEKYFLILCRRNKFYLHFLDIKEEKNERQDCRVVYYCDRLTYYLGSLPEEIEIDTCEFRVSKYLVPPGTPYLHNLIFRLKITDQKGQLYRRVAHRDNEGFVDTFEN